MLKKTFLNSYLPSFFTMTLLVCSVNAQANLVANGSFEQTSLTTTGVISINNVNHWHDNGGIAEALVFPGVGLQPLFNPPATYPLNVDLTYGLLGNFPLQSPDGGNYVFSDANYAPYTSAIYQTINGLTVGDTYQLSFYQALAQLDENITPPGAVSAYWQVSFGTDVQDSQTMTANGISQTISNWNQQDLTFTAASSSEVLSFLAVGTGLPPLAALDGVTLIAVPEPESYTLLLFGLLAVAMSVQKNKA